VALDNGKQPITIESYTKCARSRTSTAEQFKKAIYMPEI